MFPDEALIVIALCFVAVQLVLMIRLNAGIGGDFSFLLDRNRRGGKSADRRRDFRYCCHVQYLLGQRLRFSCA